MVLPILVSIASVVSVAARIATSVAIIATSIEAVAKVVIGVCKELGFIENETSSEELGNLALQAEEADIKPEKFDTYEEYLNEIQQFPLDPEKSKNYTKEEKEMKAMEVSTAILLEKFGIGVADLIEQISKHPSYFNEQRTENYLKELSKDNIDMKEIAKFFDGELKSNAAIDEIKSIILDIEEKYNPSKSRDEIEQIIEQEIV